MLYLRHQICGAGGIKASPGAQRRIIAAGGRILNAQVLTLDYCKNVLKTNGMTLEDGELKELRGYLYFLAGLQIENETAKEGQEVWPE